MADSERLRLWREQRIRGHWYAGESWTEQQKLIKKAQRDANKTGDREMVHVHTGDTPCVPGCTLIVPEHVVI